MNESTALPTAPAHGTTASGSPSTLVDTRGPAALAERSRVARTINLASASVPLALAGAGLLAMVTGQRRTGASLFGAAIGLGAVRWQMQRLFTETVASAHVGWVGDVELRQYEPQVRVETLVEGVPWPDALEVGFRRLAGYIFGDNSANERIAMTTPVFASILTDADVAHEAHSIAFVMPGDRLLESMPTPFDPRVHIRGTPAHTLATLRFNGDYKSNLPVEVARDLLSRLRAADLTAMGDVMFAGYDPPTTLPALRRNEVAVQIDVRRRALLDGATPTAPPTPLEDDDDDDLEDEDGRSSDVE